MRAPARPHARRPDEPPQLRIASDSGGRNGYLTGFDLDTGKVRWRSPALVANAENLVVTPA